MAGNNAALDHFDGHKVTWPVVVRLAAGVQEPRLDDVPGQHRPEVICGRSEAVECELAVVPGFVGGELAQHGIHQIGG